MLAWDRPASRFAIAVVAIVSPSCGHGGRTIGSGPSGADAGASPSTDAGPSPPSDARASPGTDASAPQSCRHFDALVRIPGGSLQTTSGLPFNPSGIVSDPSVLFEDGRYRMWFTSVDWTNGTAFTATDRAMGSAYAESDDGTVWDDSTLRPADPAHKIALVLQPGAWDANGVETPTVAPTGPQQLVSYYTGDRPDGTYAIGRASSSDGTTWTREESPLLEPESDWEQPVCLDPPGCTQNVGGLLEPSFVFDASSGTYHVWYAGFGMHGAALSMSIGHAWSANGGAWQRAPQPVFEPGPAGAWDEILVSHTNVVPDPAGGYHLFYLGVSQAQQAQCSAQGSCPFYEPGSIGHAFSSDGTTWTRDAAPVLVPDATAGDGFMVGGPSAVFRNGRLELFYFGIATQSDASVLRAHLSLATAACLE